MGLVDEIVAKEQVLDRGVTLWAPSCRGWLRSRCRDPRARSVPSWTRCERARLNEPEQIAAIDELVGEAYRSRDLQEGLKALSEKRKPEFEGR